jgi:hypothetical protein
MTIYLLDESLTVDVYFEEKDCSFEDNICVSIFEQCPDEERLFRAGQTNLYLTARQARLLAQAFLQAAKESHNACPGQT